jgi:hypothetical protein
MVSPQGSVRRWSLPHPARRRTSTGSRDTAAWDTERKQWRQLWVDKDRIVTLYTGGPAAGRTFVLTSEPKAGERRWLYTYRNIRPDGVDAEYASRGGEDGPWTTVWSGHFDRIEISGKIKASEP